MNSMTGFGRAEAARDSITVDVQVSSVNRKNLEVVCALPRELQRLERAITEEVRKVASRGRFQFSVEIEDASGMVSALPSDAQIDAAVTRLKSVAERHGSAFSVDADLIVSLARLLESDSSALSEEWVGDLMVNAVSEALQQLVAMRQQEGEAIKHDLLGRAQVLKSLTKEIADLAPGMVERHRENLMTRLEQAGLDLDVNDERVLKEIALYSDRCDITEELTRLESHLAQFEETLDENGRSGRRLEFLIQEISREINTTGNKANLIEISKRTLEMKNELERIREQVANVE